MDLNKDEAGLIQRVVRGDQQAFLAIYDRYSARIYALVLYILGDTMLAEEVTQDTFIKFWSRARLYASERGAFLVWLTTIARRTALDRLRLEGRRPGSGGPPALDQALLQRDWKQPGRGLRRP